MHKFKKWNQKKKKVNVTDKCNKNEFKHNTMGGSKRLEKYQNQRDKNIYNKILKKGFFKYLVII